MWLPGKRTQWKTQVNIKHCSLRLNKGEHFPAPSEGQTQSDCDTDQPSVSKQEMVPRMTETSSGRVAGLSAVSVVLHTYMIL